MLTTSDNNFVDGYVIREFPRLHELKAGKEETNGNAIGNGHSQTNGYSNGVDKHSKVAAAKPTSYLYVHPGFFRLVPFPTLTLYILAHILHVYGYYLILSQQLWATMMICECHNS